MIPNPPSVSNRIPDLPIFLSKVNQRIWDFEMLVLGFFAWFVLGSEQFEETVTGNHVRRTQVNEFYNLRTEVVHESR